MVARGMQGKLLFGQRGEVISGLWALRRLYEPRKELVLPGAPERKRSQAELYGLHGVPIKTNASVAKIQRLGLFVVAGQSTALRLMQKQFLSEVLSRGSDRVGKTGVLKGQPGQWKQLQSPFEIGEEPVMLAGGLQVLPRFAVKRNALIIPGLMSNSFLEIVSKQHAQTPYSRALLQEVKKRTIERPSIQLPTGKEIITYTSLAKRLRLH